MTVLVTGGAGFIGSNFIFYMRKKYPNDKLICLDKLTYAGNIHTLDALLNEPNFRFVHGDICDSQLVNQIFEEEHPECVINFAAESHVDRSIDFIRFLRMKYMEISLWTDRICFLQNRHLFIQAAPIVPVRLRQICWFWHTIEHMGFRLQLADVVIIMVLFSFRKNLFR